MVARDGIAEPTMVAGWPEALEKLHERISRRFARSEARERVRRYLVGLLGRYQFSLAEDLLRGGLRPLRQLGILGDD